MGVVYRGVHEKLGRPTAIKVLSSTSDDPTFSARFINEARVQAGLHHPNVATLYDFREHRDELVIFMELVDGDSLDELIEKRAFTIDEALTIFASICEAIGYIHDNGIIHRDIKSQNAKLTSTGVIKLLDFGIAKDASSHGLTQTGGIIGTPNYLSPGQLQGHPASTQSDIWALGVLLYEMLTGQLPFSGNTLGELVMRITRAEFVPADRLNPAVPRNVANIIVKCLKKRPGDRYATVRALHADVRASLQSRHAVVEAQDLRTAVMRARERPRHAYGLSTTTSPSAVFPTSLTARTRMRLLIAGAIGGGALLILFVILGVYLIGGGDTPAQGAVNTIAGDDTLKSKAVKIDVDEGKATVVRDGRTIGTTPLEIDIRPGESIRLTLHRDGFEDKEIVATAAKSVWTHSLEPKD